MTRSTTRSIRTAAAAVGIAATLVGCGTPAPLSFLNDRQVYYKAVINRYPLFVSAVDGRSTAFRPVPITPGQHELTLDAVPVAGFTVPARKVYPMTIAPCTRYYLAAQRKSPLVQDWDLVVEETWPVAGCDSATELQRAKTAAISGIEPSRSSTVESFASAAGDGSLR